MEKIRFTREKQAGERLVLGMTDTLKPRRILISSLPEMLYFRDREDIPVGTSFQLVNPPTKLEMRTTLEKNVNDLGLFCEYGLYCGIDDVWVAIKGSSHMVPNAPHEHEVHIFSHAHPRDITLLHDNELPSLQDISNAEKEEYIIHEHGVTLYTPIVKNPHTGKKWHPSFFELQEYYHEFFEAHLALVNRATDPSFDQKKSDEFHRLLYKSLGVRVVIKKWDDLPDEHIFNANNFLGPSERKI